MKFEKIKKGDIVFVNQKVRFGWGLNESFWIPEKVSRVTNTQFLTESGKRFKKSDGEEIGSTNNYSSAKLEGEKDYWSEEPVRDQTSECNDFMDKIRLECKIQDQFRKLTINLNSDLTINQLEELQSKVQEIEEILKAS